MTKALVIRTCNADMTSSYKRVENGEIVPSKPFVWPDSGPVEAPDWDPSPERDCGGGLHGLLDGVGNYSLLSGAWDAKWQIVEVEREECIVNSNKVRFKKGNVIYTGDMACAMTRISDWWIRLAIKQIKEDTKSPTSSGDSSRNASSGNYSQNASSGDSSRNASSGGYSINVATGRKSICVAAGLYSRAQAGEDGCIALAWWDSKSERYRMAVGYAGENGIKRDTLYGVDHEGNFVEERICTPT